MLTVLVEDLGSAPSTHIRGPATSVIVPGDSQAHTYKMWNKKYINKPWSALEGSSPPSLQRQRDSSVSVLTGHSASFVKCHFQDFGILVTNRLNPVPCLWDVKSSGYKCFVRKIDMCNSCYLWWQIPSHNLALAFHCFWLSSVRFFLNSFINKNVIS